MTGRVEQDQSVRTVNGTNRPDPATTSHLPRSNPGSVDRTVREVDMALGNEKIIRQAYKIAEERTCRDGWQHSPRLDNRRLTRTNRQPAGPRPRRDTSRVRRADTRCATIG